MNKKIAADELLSTDTAAIAGWLLGKLLVVPDADGRRVAGMIVETEAYLGIQDKAAHSFGGRRTKRTEVMYAAGGTVYVFFIYGMYYQLNFVCGPPEHPHAILIRGVEPVENIELVRQRRGERLADKALTSGPGKLAIAFGIDKSFNGETIDGDRIWLEEYKTHEPAEIAAGPRIGVGYAEEHAELPLRFWIKDNQFVSRGK